MENKSETVYLALLNTWTDEIKAKNFRKSELIRLSATLCIELSRYKKAIPTLEEQLKRDTTLKKLIPSLGGRGKDKANVLKRNFIHNEWLKWHSEGKTNGRYKSEFYRHLEDIFEIPDIHNKYGDLYDDKTVKRFCKAWESKY